MSGAGVCAATHEPGYQEHKGYYQEQIYENAADMADKSQEPKYHYDKSYKCKHITLLLRY
jgi:hypothetical protein